MTRFAIVVLATAMIATPAFAQSSMKPASPSAGSSAMSSSQKPSAMTENFVNKAAVTDMFEIQSGKMAEDKANNAAYKDFAKMIVDDHTKTSQEMKAMEPKLGLQLPTALDAKHKKLIGKMQSESGAKFENDFKSAQVDGHKQAVKLYEDYAKKGDNADLKQFAQKTLPTLKMHLKQAQALPKGSAAPTTGSGSKMK
jgi:putative membrane protein